MDVVLLQTRRRVSRKRKQLHLVHRTQIQIRGAIRHMVPACWKARIALGRSRIYGGWSRAKEPAHISFWSPATRRTVFRASRMREPVPRPSCRRNASQQGSGQFSQAGLIQSGGLSPRSYTRNDDPGATLSHTFWRTSLGTSSGMISPTLPRAIRRLQPNRA